MSTRKDLPISRKAVEYAYRFLLGREPENEAAYEYGLSAGTVRTLRRWILDSPEFARRLAIEAPLLLTHDFAGRLGPPLPSRETDVLFFGRNLVVHTHIEKCAGSSLVLGLIPLSLSADSDVSWRDAECRDSGSVLP